MDVLNGHSLVSVHPGGRTSTYAKYLRESSEHACDIMAVPHCQHHRAKVLHDHGSEPHQSPRVPTIPEGLAPASVGNS